MPGPPDAVVLVTEGNPDRLTGGHLYNRHLCACLQEAGVSVAVEMAPPRRDSRLLIVDSIALQAAFPWVAARPRGTVAVALMHMLPSLHARTSHDRLRWRRLEMAFLRQVDLVVAASEDLAVWVRRLEVPGDRVHVIPPGKDGPQPPPNAAHPAGGAGPSGQKDTGLRLLCVANWFPVKNIDVLVRAVADLPEDVHLDLVGDATVDAGSTERVQSEIERHALTPRVHTRGAVPPERLGAFYAAANVFVLASAHEGYATAVAEALWFGLPVVATAVGGIPHLVTAGREGLLVPPGQPQVLTRALRRLRDEAALRGRMAAAAAVRGAQLPTWTDTRAALRRILMPTLR